MTIIERATRYCEQAFHCVNGVKNDDQGNIYKLSGKDHYGDQFWMQIAYALDDGTVVDITGDDDRIMCVLK